MRLSQIEAREIRRMAETEFGPSTRVVLFGSRTDNSARGGDIDLLVEVDHPLTNRAASAARFAAKLQLTLGDQRIDVLIVDPKTPPRPIHDAARQRGVAL